MKCSERECKVIGLLGMFGLLLSSMVYAVTPNSQQIEQFKQLPKSQQAALARQYGVDLSSLQGSSASGRGDDAAPQPEQRTIRPRMMDYGRSSQRSFYPRFSGQQGMMDSPYDMQGKLKSFGYDVFAGQPTSATPLDDIPVPDDYIIGPGDELKMQLYGKENQQISLVVARDGSINFPQLGPISVAGLSFAELNQTLKMRIAKQMIGVEIAVAMGKLRTIPVFVLGDAYQPGAYNVNALTTVSQALIAAGGIDTVGSLRNIEVKRRGKLIQRVDLYQLLLSGDSKSDLRLHAGDVVFIPAKGATISIEGAVQRPAVYELTNRETLAQAVKNAGGLTAKGSKQGIELQRQGKRGITAYTLDLSKVRDRDFVVENGDQLMVKEQTERLTNFIKIQGAAVRPGVYQFRPGMHVSDLLRSVDGALKARADLGYALLVRRTDVAGNIETLQFNLADAIAKPGSSNDLKLSNRDEILIFSKELALSQSSSRQSGYFDNSDSQQRNLDGSNRSNGYNARGLMKSNAANRSYGSASGYDSVPNGFYRQDPSYVYLQGKNESRQGVSQALSGSDNSQSYMNDPQNNSALAQSGSTFSRYGRARSEISLQELGQNSALEKRSQFSRFSLLAPVLEQLRMQASNRSPAQIVEVRGAVRYPGVYPLSRGAHLSDLIAAAGGLKESADLSTAEFSRVSIFDGRQQIEHQRFILSKALDRLLSDDFTLQSKDRVNIFTKPSWREESSVAIKGEVKFPGVYTIRQGETIADLVKRAGGATRFAYPEGAVFSRESLRIQEASKLAMLRQQMQQEVAQLTLRRQTSEATYPSSPLDAMKVIDNLQTVKPLGRLVINLPQILQGKKQDDIMLQGGDTLVVPPLEKTITVVGQVQYSASFVFDPSLSVAQYLEQAGGVKQQADRDRIYVIRANGSVMLPNNSYWFSRKEQVLQPGDTIVVPINSDYLDNLSSLSIATKMLFQIGAAWNAVK